MCFIIVTSPSDCVYSNMRSIFHHILVDLHFFLLPQKTHLVIRTIGAVCCRGPWDTFPPADEWGGDILAEGLRTVGVWQLIKT